MPINSIDQTKKINRFKKVYIPSPKDLYLQYGERLGKGEYTTSADEIGEPVPLGGSSVIDQMVSAQEYLASATEQKKP